MAAVLQGHQVHPDGRAWKTHFPEGDLWVFGYGSLIWKPPPHYDQRVPGYIDGFVRRFWQASTDHRGTPEQPGRVVTVIDREFWETLDDPHAELESESASTGKVWGAAYHIPASHAEEVHDYLDEREIDGYSVRFTPFHPNPGSSADQQGHPDSIIPITCMVYIGQPTNPQFLREPERRAPKDVARVISAGHGQSGKNTEYLYLLEKALEGLGLGTADVHVADLILRESPDGCEVRNGSRKAANRYALRGKLHMTLIEARPCQIESCMLKRKTKSHNKHTYAHRDSGWETRRWKQISVRISCPCPGTIKIHWVSAPCCLKFKVSSTLLFVHTGRDKVEKKKEQVNKRHEKHIQGEDLLRVSVQNEKLPVHDFMKKAPSPDPIK